MADSAEVQAVAQSHEWRGGYFCSCGHELNSAWGYNQHFITALDEAGVLGGRDLHLRAAGIIVMQAEQFDRMMQDDNDA